MSDRRFRRLLAFCPALVLLLWIAGIAHFRAVELDALQWILVGAAVLALRGIGRRLQRPRPMPPLPPGRSPMALAALASAVLAVPAGLFGGVLEWLLDAQQPSTTPCGLRVLWHAACMFASSYCTLLLRLTAPPGDDARPPTAPPPPPGA